MSHSIALPMPLPSARWGVIGTGTRRHEVIRAAAGVAVAVAVTVACIWPGFVTDTGMASATVLVTASFVAAGSFVAREPDRRTPGLLISCAGLLWPLNSSTGWVVGPMPFIRSFVEGVFWIVLAWGVFLYQHPRMERPERLLLGYMIVHFLPGNLLWASVSTPAWLGYPDNAWWPTLVADEHLFDVVNATLITLDLPIGIVFATIVVARQKRVRGLDRHSVAPIVVAIVSAALVAGLSWAIYGRTTIADALVLLGLPVAFLISALRRRLVQARVSDVLGRLTGTLTLPMLTSSLQIVLRDPTLTVSYWLPEQRCYVDERGREVEPGRAGERLYVPVHTGDGQPLAMVSTHVTAAGNRGLVTTAVQAIRLALENAHLQVVVQTQGESVRQAQALTARAALEERRRLERDLHDGAQQRLLAVATAIGLASHQVGDPAVSRMLGRATEDLRHALRELRELANGLHPAVLTGEGLAGAVQGLAERLDIPTQVDVTTVRLAPGTECTAYFVICEALTNVVKHARATSADVRATVDDEGLQVEVRDDGLGGADPGGHGLRGLRERVEALGGRFAVESRACAGTVLRAWLPCE